MRGRELSGVSEADPAGPTGRALFSVRTAGSLALNIPAEQPASSVTMRSSSSVWLEPARPRPPKPPEPPLPPGAPDRRAGTRDAEDRPPQRRHGWVAGVFAAPDLDGDVAAIAAGVVTPTGAAVLAIAARLVRGALAPYLRRCRERLRWQASSVGDPNGSLKSYELERPAYH